MQSSLPTSPLAFLLAPAAGLSLTLLLAGCGGGDEDGGGAGRSPDGTGVTEAQRADAYPPADPEKLAALEEKLKAFYDAEPDTFTFATPADLPADLSWENGSEQEEMGSPEAIKGGTHNYFLPDFPRTLRLVGPDASSAFRRYLLDDTSVALNTFNLNTLAPVPGIASEWAIGPDKKTVFYKLNPAATYSDGVPVTADDFFFCIYFMRSEHIKAPWYQDMYKTRIANITKFDDHTLSITYSEAKPDIVYKTNLIRPVPRHFYGDFGEDFVADYNFRFEPTTGPYEVVPANFEKGKAVTLTRVPDWWAADLPNFRYRFNPDRIHLKVIRDPNVALETFKAGGIDCHGLNLPEFWYIKIPDDLEQVEDGYIEKSTFFNQVPPPTWSLNINCDRIPDQDIRLGINYSLNWRALDQVFYGDYVRMPFYGDGYGEVSHPTLEARSFDPELAAEHFAAAGYTEREPDGVLRNAEGERLAFTITTGYERLEDVLTVLKQEALKAGLHLDLEILEMTAGWKKIDEKKHEIALGAKNVSPELYPRYWETFHSYHAYNEDGSVKTDTNNDTVTNVAELDALIDVYRASDDLGEMTELSHQIIQIVHDHGAWIPGWKRPFLRLGRWRWMRYPDNFDFRTVRAFDESWVFWIDEEMKGETLRARRSGDTFPPVIEDYDPFGLRQ